jgi:hypothetical protein
VVHVDGGAPISIRGVGFARSQWLKCSFSMSDGTVKVIKAAHFNNNVIVCNSPGSPDQTVSSLEVTNGGVGYFTDFQIPIYMMERVVSFPLTGGKVTITDACDMIGTNLFSMGAWVYPLSQSSSALEDEEDVISLNGMTSNSQTGLLSVRYDGVRFVVHEKIGNTETALGESPAAPAHNMGEGSGWHYVMLSGNMDRLVLYMDGESTELTATSISLSTCDLELGTTTTGRKAFFGYVEEMSTFSGFLEACDAYQIMWGNFTRFPITPVGQTVQKIAATISPVQRALYLRFNGVLDPTSSLVTVPDDSDHGYPGILSGDASLLWTTVPFLKPSFNRRRPRVGPPVSLLRTLINPRLNRIDLNGLMTENYTVPRRHQAFYEYVDETVLEVNGSRWLKVLGFGFTESKWLRCELNGALFPAKYVSLDEVHCDIGSTAFDPSTEEFQRLLEVSIGVMSLFPTFNDQPCTAGVALRSQTRGQVNAQPLMAYAVRNSVSEAPQRSYAYNAYVDQGVGSESSILSEGEGAEFVDVRDLSDVVRDSLEEFAVEFGSGTEVTMAVAQDAQGPPGLLARYYGSGVERQEVQESMTMSYGTSAPVNGISSDDWSLELTGYIYAPFSRDYTFTAEADDSVRLWVNRGTFTLRSLVAGEDDGVEWGRTGPTVTVNNGQSDGTDWVNVINEPCIVSSTCPLREVTGTAISLSEGWNEIYFSYSDKSGTAQWSLQWQTTDNIIPKQIIRKRYLRAGTGPTVVEMWVWPYRVNGLHSIVSRASNAGQNAAEAGFAVGIAEGKFTASVYIGCDCAQCDKFHEINSWKSPVRANTWQHLYAAYDGTRWVLYVDGVKTDETDFGMVYGGMRYSRFVPESRAPLVMGREMDREVIEGSPSDIRRYYGLVYSFAVWAQPKTSAVLSRPDENLGDDLMAYLPLTEGGGLQAKDLSGNGTLDYLSYFGNASIVAPSDNPRVWVHAIPHQGKCPVKTGSPFTLLVDTYMLLDIHIVDRSPNDPSGAPDHPLLDWPAAHIIE